MKGFTFRFLSYMTIVKGMIICVWACFNRHELERLLNDMRFKHFYVFYFICLTLISRHCEDYK